MNDFENGYSGGDWSDEYNLYGLHEGIDIISGVELLGFADRDYPLVGLTG